MGMPWSEVSFSIRNSRNLSNESKESRRILAHQVLRKAQKFCQILVLGPGRTPLPSRRRPLRAPFQLSGELLESGIAQFGEIVLLPGAQGRFVIAEAFPQEDLADAQEPFGALRTVTLHRGERHDQFLLVSRYSYRGSPRTRIDAVPEIIVEENEGFQGGERDRLRHVGAECRMVQPDTPFPQGTDGSVAEFDVPCRDQGDSKRRRLYRIAFPQMFERHRELMKRSGRHRHVRIFNLMRLESGELTCLVGLIRLVRKKNRIPIEGDNRSAIQLLREFRPPMNQAG